MDEEGIDVRFNDSTNDGASVRLKIISEDSFQQTDSLVKECANFIECKNRQRHFSV